MTHSPKILFAVPADFEHLDELWSSYARKRAEALKLKVSFIEDKGSIDDLRWAELLKGVEGLITSWPSPNLNKVVLSKNNSLKIMGHAGGSVSNKVSDELYRRGVKVTTANYAMASSVAEWCLTMTLAGRRNFLAYTQFGNKTQMRWANQSRCTGLQTATVGIWGFGAVSEHLVKYLIPLNPKKILVHSGHLAEKQANDMNMTKVGFDELFEKSDVIHLLAGLTESNKGRVGQKQLALIKDGAVLINVGRAGLVQEKSLLEELKKQRFTGIFDVYHEEPLADDNLLRQLPNVILTPHNGGRPSWTMLVATVLEEFDRFFRGKPLRYEISRQRATTMTMNKR